MVYFFHCVPSIFTFSIVIKRQFCRCVKTFVTRCRIHSKNINFQKLAFLENCVFESWATLSSETVGMNQHEPTEISPMSMFECDTYWLLSFVCIVPIKLHVQPNCFLMKQKKNGFSEKYIRQVEFPQPEGPAIIIINGWIGDVHYALSSVCQYITVEKLWIFTWRF